MIDCGLGGATALATATDGSTFLLSALSGINDPNWTRYGAHIVKYDADMQPIWNQVYKSMVQYGDLTPTRMTPTSDGGLAFAGKRSVQTTDTLLLVKVGPDGSVDWARCMPVPLPDGAQATYYTDAMDVAEATNGDLLVVGKYTYYFGGLSARRTEGFVARISASGTTLWCKKIVNDPTPTSLNSVCTVLPLAEGGMAVLGLTASGASNMWLAELDEDGTIIWSKRITISTGQYVREPRGLVRTTSGYTLYLPMPLPSTSLGCLVHLDENGAFVSAKRYALPGLIASEGDMVPLPDGGSMIVGSAYPEGSTTYWGDLQALRVAEDGDIAWSIGLGSTGDERGFAVATAGDGGFLFAGEAYYHEHEDYRGVNSEPLLVKTTSDGTYAGCGRSVEASATDTVLTVEEHTLAATPLTGWIPCLVGTQSWIASVEVCTSTGLAEAPTAHFILSPNPASTTLTIRSTQGTWMHELIDATGRVLLQQRSNSDSATLDVADIAPGRYVLRSRDAHTVHGTALMVVR